MTDVPTSAAVAQPSHASDTRQGDQRSPRTLATVTATSAAKQRTFAQEIRRRVIFWSVAFVVYVLSLGPMYWTWFDAKYNEGSAWIAVIYEPLYIVSEWCPPLARLIDWYLRLWIF